MLDVSVACVRLRTLSLKITQQLQAFIHDSGSGLTEDTDLNARD